MIVLIAVTLTTVAAIIAGLLGLAYIEWGRVILVAAPLCVVWWVVWRAVNGDDLI